MRWHVQSLPNTSSLIDNCGKDTEAGCDCKVLATSSMPRVDADAHLAVMRSDHDMYSIRTATCSSLHEMDEVGIRVLV